MKDKNKKTGPDEQAEKFIASQGSSSAIQVNKKQEKDDYKLNNFWVNNLIGHAQEAEVKKPGNGYTDS